MISKNIMKNIVFKLVEVKNKPWVNGAEPSVAVVGKDVQVTYQTEKEDAPGKSGGEHTVTFKDCLMYRAGDPNDHGFYQGHMPEIVNKTIYTKSNFPDLEFDTLNEVSGVNWKEELLGEETVVVDEVYKNVDPAEFFHYLWFMKDGSFECVARSHDAGLEN